jgi:uncharacterized membrane protein YkvA (DUF1232 family)
MDCESRFGYPERSMQIINALRNKARALKREILALYYAYTGGNLPLSAKLMVALTLAYALSPIDLIPDFIPIIGYLDDLLIVPALIALSIRLIPPAVLAEARARAEREPLSLRKNWFTGAVFILVWLVLAAAIILAIL